MEIMEIVRGVGEYLLPQLKEISTRLDRIEAVQGEMSKRLDDIDTHLNKRIDDLNTALSRRIDGIEGRMTGMEVRIDARLNSIDQRLDTLYQVIVRRDEHIKLEERVMRLEEGFRLLKEKLVA